MKQRIVFMGSPSEVIPPLEGLIAAGYEVLAVVSQPAKPQGRHQKLADPPLAAFAKSQGLTTLQPALAKDPDFLQNLKNLAPDVIVTAAYGQILSDEFLMIPKRGTINIHPSLLPKYRGATPVAQSIANGDRQTGVTILFTVKKLDAGAMIVQHAYERTGVETTGELNALLFEKSREHLLEALRLIEDPKFIGRAQDESQVTHCKKINKQDGLLDFTKPAQELLNHFLAHEPWPGSYTFCQGKRLSIAQMRLAPMSQKGETGEVTFDRGLKALLVNCGEGSLAIEKLKPAGKNIIAAADFWNGLRDKENVRFTLHE